MTQNNPRDERHQQRWRAEVERRLRALETAPRAGHTSISNGKLLVRDGTTGELIASLAGIAGTDTDGNPFPAGLSAQAGSMNGQIIQPQTITAEAIAAGAIVAGKIAAGAVDAMTITGATVITDSNTGGLFVYDGVPQLGNLIVSVASEPGTDDFGNAYPQGVDVNQGSIAGSLITVEPGPGNGIFVYGTMPTVTTFNSGSGTWVCPAGVTSVKVECWGGGGSGSGYDTADNLGGGGGGGGEYAAEPTFAVTPGNSYAYSVGAGGAAVSTGGTAGHNGGNTTFAGGAVTAHGGVGPAATSSGAGGSGSTNTTHFNGGIGSLAFSSSVGGSGGGSGGYGSAGNNAPDGGPTGAVAVTGGGPGGNSGTSTKAGTAGGAPGGGGGGPGSQRTSGAGGPGRVTITYTPARTLLASIAGASGTDPYGNTYPAGLAAASPTFTGPLAYTSWTPVLGNGGSATFSVADGWYYMIGDLVFFSAELAASAAGSGTGNLTITLPVTPYRASGTRRQAYVGALTDAVGTGGQLGALGLVTFAGGAVGIDGVYMSNGARMQGQHIAFSGGTGTIITIQGVYRKA